MRTIYGPIYTPATLRARYPGETGEVRRVYPARLVNEAAQQYFVGNAQALKQLEMVETALRDTTKVVITEHGISPALLLGSLPISAPGEKQNGREVSRQA